jgi:hypothetical protein
MVEPDFADCLRNPADLRAAFHAASSLFHMHDWVWKTHEIAIRGSFTFTDTNGRPTKVHDNRSFANALEQHCEDFGRIRGIANAAKHLEINVRPIPNAPSHAAQTSVKVMPAPGGYGVGAMGYSVSGSYGGGPRVVLAGPNSTDMAFSHIARTVYDMWTALRAKHGW